MKFYKTRIILTFVAALAFWFSSCDGAGGGNAGSGEGGDGTATETYDEATAWQGVNTNTAQDASFMSQLEKDVLNELNKVRANPKAYAQLYIKPMTSQFNGNVFTGYGYNLITNEGAAAVSECVAALNSQTAKSALSPSEGLTKAAKEWAQAQGSTGGTGHGDTWARIQKYGTYTSAAENIAYGFDDGRKIVVQLLIDDGVSSRGHRTNIFGDYTHVGIGCGPHNSSMKYICVQNFAKNFKEK